VRVGVHVRAACESFDFCRRSTSRTGHREGCWWDYRSRKLQDYELSRMFGTDKDGKLLNFRTDFSARES
jgi:hypothetical protein